MRLCPSIFLFVLKTKTATQAGVRKKLNVPKHSDKSFAQQLQDVVRGAVYSPYWLTRHDEAFCTFVVPIEKISTRANWQSKFFCGGRFVSCPNASITLAGANLHLLVWTIFLDSSLNWIFFFKVLISIPLLKNKLIVKWQYKKQASSNLLMPSYRFGSLQSWEHLQKCRISFQNKSSCLFYFGSTQTLSVSSCGWLLKSDNFGIERLTFWGFEHF